MIDFTNWDLRNYLMLLALLVSIGALYYNALSYNRNSRAIEFRNLKELSDEILNLHSELIEAEDNKKKIDTFDSKFLNKMEFFSFMANQKEIRFKYVLFFKDLIIDAHNHYLKKYNPKAYKDSKQYEELKTLYKKIKKL